MPVPWSIAWSRSATGPDGFWRRETPVAHFTTSTGTVLARAMVRLLGEVDARLGFPATVDVMDVGAGEGRLLEEMRALLDGTDLGSRARLTGIDVRERPSDLPEDIAWGVADATRDSLPTARGLVMAHEWLDEVPLDIVERDTQGADRIVLVDDDGRESLGAPPGADAAAWMAAWWPLQAIGERAEVGLSRDAAWARLCAMVEAGTLLATDYGHIATERRPTLRGYRSGNIVDPTPDGSCNITAHVAMDACAAATPLDMAVTMDTQAAALAALGLSGGLPDPSVLTPAEYARKLSVAWEAQALRDPAGRGSFTWLRADR